MGLPVRAEAGGFPAAAVLGDFANLQLVQQNSEGRIFYGVDCFVAPSANAPDLVLPPVAQVAAPARPRYEAVGLVIVMQLRSLGAARAVVPLGVLPCQARANGAVLVAAPATDACQFMAPVLMSRKVLQGGGPGLEAEPAPPQLGLVQEVHISLTAALALHDI